MHMCALDLLSILFVIIVVGAATALLLFTLTQFEIVLKINGTLVALASPGRITVNGTEIQNPRNESLTPTGQIKKIFKLQTAFLAKTLFMARLHRRVYHGAYELWRDILEGVILYKGFILKTPKDYKY